MLQIVNVYSFYEIFKTELNICQDSPMILLDLNENMMALFYQYCMVNGLDEKQGQFQIEIKAKIWFQKMKSKNNMNNYLVSNSNYDFMNQDDQEQTQDDQSLIKLSFNYQASNTLILAKLILVQQKGSQFQSLIFFEEEFSQFYVGQYVFSLDQNSIITLKMIQLQYDTIQILQSISTNKYETLFMYDQSNDLIHSESTLENFIFNHQVNRKIKNYEQKEPEGQTKISIQKSDQKQLLLN